MRLALSTLFLVASSLNVQAQLVDMVRGQINQGDFDGARKTLADFKSRYGATPEMLQEHVHRKM